MSTDLIIANRVCSYRMEIVAHHDENPTGHAV